MASYVENILLAWENFLVQPFETDFNQDWAVKFTLENYALVFAIAVAYLVLVGLSRRYMDSREPFDLKAYLALWNIFLAAFSFCGTFRMLPFLLRSLRSNGYEITVCSDPVDSWGNGPTGLWMTLFMFSKVPELVDTMFIVLRKKPLPFLHWYHHFTVLLYCWLAYSVKTGSGILFAPMNCFVHAVMYTYYGAAALGMVPKWFPTIVITLGQILQMFVGVGICISGWYYYLNDIPCSNDVRMLVAAALMYLSYLYLFVDYFYGRFIAKKTSPSPPKEKKEK